MVVPKNLGIAAKKKSVPVYDAAENVALRNVEFMVLEIMLAFTGQPRTL